eukprot:13827867-Alexandrium_andersonii.AAC.1
MNLGGPSAPGGAVQHERHLVHAQALAGHEVAEVLDVVVGNHLGSVAGSSAHLRIWGRRLPSYPRTRNPCSLPT